MVYVCAVFLRINNVIIRSNSQQLKHSAAVPWEVKRRASKQLVNAGCLFGRKWEKWVQERSNTFVYKAGWSKRLITSKTIPINCFWQAHCQHLNWIFHFPKSRRGKTILNKKLIITHFFKADEMYYYRMKSMNWIKVTDWWGLTKTLIKVYKLTFSRLVLVNLSCQPAFLAKKLDFIDPLSSSFFWLHNYATLF